MNTIGSMNSPAGSQGQRLRNSNSLCDIRTHPSRLPGGDNNFIGGVVGSIEDIKTD